MPEAYARIEPSLIPILRPRCATCQGRMMLTCIEPGCNECSKCGHVYKAPAEDPMKSTR
jgi:ribosomal protein L37AE/L43A